MNAPARSASRAAFFTAARRRFTALLFALAIIAGAAFQLLRENPGTDEEQIRSLFMTGKFALERKDVRSVMRLVSTGYHDDLGLNRDRLRVLLAQSLRDVSQLSIGINGMIIRPEGETADAILDVTVDAAERGQPETRSEARTVTFTLRKEPGTRFLVIPTKRWKVVEAGGSGLALGEELLGF